MSDKNTALQTPRRDGAVSHCDRAAIPIDFSILAQLSGGDRSVEIRMLSIFRKSNVTDAAALEDAIQRQDIAAVARVSHRLMGASRIAGAKDLANVCDAIEQAALSGNWGGVMANGDAWYRELERVTAYLRILGGSPAPTS